jgi:hypothetical protein
VTSEQIVAILSKQAAHAVAMRRAEQLRDNRQRGVDGADWPADHLRQRLLQLAYCDAGTSMPLLLELFDRRDRNELDQAELFGCLQDLVGFLVRRSIAGEKTKQYDKKFVEIARNLGSPVRKSLQDALHRIGWPSDAVVLAALRTFPLYASESSKARLILEELERSYRSKEKVQLAPLQIEHVLPQKLSGADAKEWKDMLGARWRDDHERAVHTLGNLTLTGFNQTMSNKSFATKRTTLKASKLTLNEAFHGLRRWNADSIDARGEQIGREFLERFPVVGDPPPVGEDELHEKAQKADRNREFWRLVSDRIAELDGEMLAGNPSGKPFLDLPTNFRCLKIVPYFNRRTSTIGVMASFLGSEGDKRFATVRASLKSIEDRFGCPLAEHARSKGSAADFHFERVVPEFATSTGEADAIDWLAEHASRLRTAIGPAMEAAGARIARSRSTERHLTRKRWFQQLLERARARLPLHAHRTASVDSWVSAASGVMGLTYVYVVAQRVSRVELYIMHDRKDPERPKRRYAWFEARRREIAKLLPDLVWERLDGKEACRLSIPVEGGYRSPDADWPKIHDAVIDRMIRLHETMQPLIERGEVERA